jgi:lysozyme family protein
VTIDQILTEVLRREGWPKVTDRPSDRGGLTKGGVTYANYNAWRVKHGERPLMREEFVAITEADARAFFEDEFCRPFAFVDGPTTHRLYHALADWSVNAGPDDPARALQHLLADRGLYRGALDGIVGPATRLAWLMAKDDAADVRAIELALIAARVEFHLERAFDAEVRDFLRTHPRTQLHNLRGWTRRALGFLREEAA